MPSPRLVPKNVIKLALRSQSVELKSYASFEREFQKALGCDLDYARRLLNGTRLLRERHRELIRELLRLPTLDFDATPRDIAVQLNLSSKDALSVMSGGLPGLEFAARTRDLTALSRLSDLVSGYWELVFWSFSRTDTQALSRELCVIERPDEAGLLPCTVHDVNFTYRGVVFPVMSHLYFMVEKEHLFDEVVVYLTNRPERAPPVLRGISLGLSGGVDEIRSHPTASRCTFRYLGRTAADVRIRFPEAPDDETDLLDFLRREVPRYLTQAELAELSTEQLAALQVSRLDNSVPPNAIPFVLQAKD
ncbi:hypothetical protein G7078_07295 [Sphingomonas sinipercae]|uniref:Uncharacterized protein n=1 Tax=Sphingomonas sinipercae TaxID=2714944 RepID=A0A6G7ZNW1_9SPHN|nr:hypothetical protein [Sphingomonas sinipercae]QIL02612.1 hypothetical protein G7078_07295 [Sphingomonas sinipercae]